MRPLHLLLLGLLLPACNCGPTGPTPNPAGTWKYRYNCGTSAQCFDADQCDTLTLTADGADAGAFKNSAGTLTGTLSGTVLTWKARWGNPPYDEVGTFTFSDDFTSFTQTTCYTSDGTTDLATQSCTGQSRGQCTGVGAKTNPGPPPAVGACPAGGATSSCN